MLLLVAAAPTQQQLRDAERAHAAQIEAQRAAAAQAAAAARVEQVLAAQRVQAAEKLRALETATDDAAAKVQALAAEQRAAQVRLAARAADMAPLLPLIERLSLYPAETLLAVPMPAEQAVRGVLVLGGLTRRLEADAVALRGEQARLTTLQQQLNDELPKLAAAKADQAQAETALDVQIAEAETTRKSAEDAGEDAARQAAADAARASSLRTAIARLDAEQHRAEAAARSQQQALAQPGGAGHGQLIVPVAGTVLRDFGDPTDAGPATGVSYTAAPGARVVSPCGGRAVFAGPFRSFGQLLIIDCGAGTHIVMSGFDRLDAQVGQALQPGEPVGVMPDWDPRAGSARPSLYVELRHGDQPVNPAPFLRAKG